MSGQILPHPRRPNDPNWAFLTGFDTGRAELKPVHRHWLLGRALPALRARGWVFLRGYASHRYETLYNLRLSERRARRAAAFLLRRPDFPMDHITRVDAVGEAWSGGGREDNSPRWRAVEVIITPHARVIQVPGFDIRGRRWRVRWREVVRRASGPQYSLAGPTDSPPETTGGAIGAIVQRASSALNDASVDRRIQAGLGDLTRQARAMLADHDEGGVLAVAELSVSRFPDGQTGRTVDFVQTVPGVFPTPEQAIGRYRRMPTLSPGGPGTTHEYRYFWASWEHD